MPAHSHQAAHAPRNARDREESFTPVLRSASNASIMASTSGPSCAMCAAGAKGARTRGGQKKGRGGETERRKEERGRKEEGRERGEGGARETERKIHVRAHSPAHTLTRIHRSTQTQV